MGRMVITYLVVTGIGGAAVLAMPWLIAIGLVLLIIPGLILALMPSAFCYGLAFAAIWFPLRRIFGQGEAAVIAVVGTFALFWMVPDAGNRATEARYNAEHASDHLPSAPIALSGDIRLESATLLSERDREKTDRRAAPLQARYDHARCQAVCAALLFARGVTSVTITTSQTDATTPQPLSPDAATFRLEPRAGCTAPIEQRLDYKQFGPGTPGALKDDWKLRLSTGECVVVGPPVTQADFILLATHFKTPMTATYEQRPKALGARPVTVRRFEIFHAGKSLLRSTLAEATRLYQPLFYGPVDDGYRRFDFAWGDVGEPHTELDEIALLALLAEHTSLQVTPDDQIAARVRERIGQLLDNPAIPASNPGFTLTDRFFKAMADDGAPEADVALLTRMIGDDRFVAFDGIWAPAAQLGPRLEALRAPIVARLRRADPTTQGALSQLGGVLGRLPPDRRRAGSAVPHGAGRGIGPARDGAAGTRGAVRAPAAGSSRLAHGAGTDRVAGGVDPEARQPLGH